MMEPEDIRLLTMTSFAAGASGVLNLRFRPLLDGPLFGAFGSYGMDGSRTPRSDMACALAQWANGAAQREVFAARPVQGDIGILVIPEAQAWDYLLNNKHRPETYSEAMWGAYRGFFDNGIQADWVHVDDLDSYDAIYAPYPIMLTSENASRLARWVEQGGRLISEACPGYFGDRRKVGTAQPNHGLDTLFGVREDEVEFMPDIGDRISFEFAGETVGGGGFLQSYTLTTGTGRGRFTDGRLAVAEHASGRGRTLLVGTNPGIGYFRTSSEANRRYFAEVFAWTGKTQHLRLSNPLLQARLRRGDGRSILWVINSSRKPQRSTIAWGQQHGTPKLGNRYWGAPAAAAGPEGITVPARDALIVALEN